MVLGGKKKHISIDSNSIHFNWHATRGLNIEISVTSLEFSYVGLNIRNCGYCALLITVLNRNK